MEKKKIGKRIIEKGNGEKGRERKEKGGGRGGARQRRPRARSATRGVRPAGGGARVGGEREKGEGKKEGRDSRRPVTTRRVGWEKDGTRIEFGCRVARGRFWGLGFRVLGESSSTKDNFSA